MRLHGPPPRDTGARLLPAHWPAAWRPGPVTCDCPSTYGGETTDSTTLEGPRRECGGQAMGARVDHVTGPVRPACEGLASCRPGPRLPPDRRRCLRRSKTVTLRADERMAPAVRTPPACETPFPL